VSDKVKNDSILVLSSKLKSNDRSERDTSSVSASDSAVAILLAYDEKMIRFVPGGRSKVITLPFRLSILT
jgi:hypothetical protein